MRDLYNRRPLMPRGPEPRIGSCRRFGAEPRIHHTGNRVSRDTRELMEEGAIREPWRAVARHRLRGDRLLGPLMLAPAILYIVALVGFPLLLAIYLSFSNATTAWQALNYGGLTNFARALDSTIFRAALTNTFVFTLVSEILVIVLGNVLALTLQQKFRGRPVVRFLILMPWAAPFALGAIGWKWMFDSLYSVVNWMLRAIQQHACAVQLGLSSRDYCRRSGAGRRDRPVLAPGPSGRGDRHAADGEPRGSRRLDVPDILQGDRTLGAVPVHRGVHLLRSLPVRVDGDHGVQAHPRPVQHPQQPVPVQSAPDHGEHTAALWGDPVHALAGEYGVCRGVRRPHHVAGRRASRIQPRAPRAGVGPEVRNRDLPHLSRTSVPAVHPARSGRFGGPFARPFLAPDLGRPSC